MNHAMSHIFHGVGKVFVLTPELVDFVWCGTMPAKVKSEAEKGGLVGKKKEEGMKVEVEVEGDGRGEKKEDGGGGTNSPPPPYTPTPTTVAEAEHKLEPSASPAPSSPATAPKSTSPEAPTPPTTTFTPNIPPSSPSPLRLFLLDVLTTYWSFPNCHLIARLPHQQAAWTAVFDKHGDLRREFIFGMQGGAKMGGVEKYCV